MDWTVLDRKCVIKEVREVRKKRKETEKRETKCG
jgi:hypothetical protein